VEETPKKLRDVIEASYQVRRRERDSRSFKLEEEELDHFREQILTSELTVLQAISFDLTVEHPYKYLLSYVKGIHGDKNLAQVAWNFVNDSYRTTLSLQHKPQLIASAAILMASKFLKYKFPEGEKPWWELLGVSLKELEDICQDILELYESSPNWEVIKTSWNANKTVESKQTIPPIEHNQPEISKEIRNISASIKKKSNSPPPNKSKSPKRTPSPPRRNRTSRSQTPNNRSPIRRSRSPIRRSRSPIRSRNSPRMRSVSRSLSRSRSRSRGRSRSPIRRSRSPYRRSRSPSPSPRSRSNSPVRNYRPDRRGNYKNVSRDSYYPRARPASTYRNNDRRYHPYQ